MSSSQARTTSRPMNLLLRALDGVERLGNKLPHPFWLFVILSAVLALASWALSAAGVSAVNPATGKTVEAKNLLSADGVRMMVTDAVKSYTSFPPLGTILVVMLGVAVAERSGLLAAVLRSGVSKVSPRWVTFALAFTGMVSHVASDAAYVVLIPLGALAFRAVGRSPILGIVVAFVSISAGYDASPLITPTDAILSGLTTAAAQTIDPAYSVTPLANYFFSLASSIVLAAVITLVTEKVLARRAEAMPVDDDAEEDDLGSLRLSRQERRGLLAALIALAVFVVALVLAVLPASSPLRGKGGSIIESPLLTSISIFLALGFLAAGWAYGKVAGTVTSSRDIPGFMAHGFREMAPILVLFFAISQFLAYFKWTGIGEITAINGAGLLKNRRGLRAGRHAGHPRRGDPGQPDRHQRLRPVGTDRPGVRADADAAGHPAGDHAGAVPHRGFVHERDHPDEPVLRDGAGFPAALPAFGGDRHAVLDDGPALVRPAGGVDVAVLRVLGVRHPARPRRPRSLGRDSLVI